jgi:hypothetical protein
MMRMTGRTGLETIRRVAAATVVTVGLAGSAWAADPVKDAAAAATPVATAAAAALATPDAKDAEKKDDGQDPAPAANPVVEFFKQTEISGLVDGYYLWNFNEETTQLRNFDIQHNAFSLNYVEIAFAKPVSETSRGGFRVDFGAGETANLVNAFEPGGTDYLKYVQQAYVSYLAPVGSGLTIDFGKFVTPTGAEVIENKDNFNYSRGLMFALPIPYYHAGLRVGYAVNDKVSVTGFLLNGWNNVIENNGAKTVGVSVGIKPNDKTGLFFNYLVGDEWADDDDGGVRNLFDVVGSFAVTDKVSLLGQFDYGRDSFEGDDLNWYGIGLAMKYQADENWAFSPRYEWYVDDDGFTTGLEQTLQSLTLTGEYKAEGGLITRFEFRNDFSDEDFFVKGDGLKSNQPTLSVAFIYAFSSK